jgi:hypothetical protein
MSVPRRVSDIIQNHVKLEVESIDRMYLNVYQPKLQVAKGVANFFRYHRGNPIPSSALMQPISQAFITSLEKYAADRSIDLIPFPKDRRKEQIALEYRRKFQGGEGVLFIGKAQEKAKSFRTQQLVNPMTGKKYPWIVQSSALVNQYYVYFLDDDFGPCFLKFSSYFPYNAKLCINGHEYAKRQLAKENIAFEELDNGFLSCADPKRLQEICAGLSAEKIDALLRKWLALLPHPFTSADRAAGYRYDVSMLQSEFSLTQVLDCPRNGRLFFEQVIRENLDLGRPDQVQLIFNRRINKRTPGKFRTRVLTEGVIPSLHIDYKSSKIK